MGRGFDVDIYCDTRADTYVLPHILSLGASVRHLPVSRRPSPLRDFRAVILFWLAFRSTRPEISISLVPKTGLVAGIGAFLAGVTVRCHIFQGEVWYGKTGWYRAIFRMFDASTAGLASHCLCVSESEREYLVENCITHRRKLNVLGKGSICGVVMPQLLKPRTNRQVVNILFVGRVTHDKGIFDLLEAFLMLLARGLDVLLKIVGPIELKGRFLNSYKASCSKLAERVEIISFEPNLETIYQSCDILCLPSHREGFGMVAIEASSYAKPVVGYDIVGLCDAVIDGKTGLLCPARDVGALCDALEKLVINPRLRESLGKAGRSYVEANFRRDQVITRYADYISSLLAVICDLYQTFN